uniref:Uncharacterized protein n=1 Tax=Arundo donax TaxID=35708 RepID=A0A0A9GG62_ARUDO
MVFLHQVKMHQVCSYSSESSQAMKVITSSSDFLVGKEKHFFASGTRYLYAQTCVGYLVNCEFGKNVALN